MWGRLVRVMQLRQLSAGVAGLTLGLLLDFASDWLTGSGAGLVPLVALIFIAALSVSAWLWWRDPSRVGLALQPVKTLRTEAEKRQHARRGLIALVSLYRPTEENPAARLTPEDWRAAAKQRDYAALDLPNSNLATTIEAITSHASQLEHCWLIGTTAANPEIAGSHVYIPALVAYLNRERDLGCTFHYGQEFNLSLDDDALVFDKTVDIVREIFLHAESIGLGAPDVIADFTGGMRSMTLGMILACLDGDRDIEMIGTRYSPEGNWTGAPFPIIFRFEPILQQR
jgi:hypothetical protein